mgnify:CR=1 FL=1
MLKQEEIIKIDCRTDVLKFIKSRLDNITIADFYSAEEYELIRQEYMEIAEMVRDKDKLMEWYQQRRHTRNKNISKYFNFDK